MRASRTEKNGGEQRKAEAERHSESAEPAGAEAQTEFSMVGLVWKQQQSLSVSQSHDVRSVSFDSAPNSVRATSPRLC